MGLEEGSASVAPDIDHYNGTDSPLFKALECDADGRPGGILITSVGQEVIPNVWIGGYRAYEDTRFLTKNKIKYILTLGHFKYQYPPSEFVHKIVAITDHPEANILQYFPETNKFIDAALSEGSHILVHCLAGVSRSPTVLAAYLMHKRHLRPKEALAMIKRSRPFVNPNPGFLDQLRLYHEMGDDFDPTHPAYIAYRQQHPYDASHAGHDEYTSSE